MNRPVVSSLFGFPFFIGKGINWTPPATTRDFDASAMEVDRTGISPLFGTQQEIETVGDILEEHKMKTTIYSGELASDDR